MRLVVVRAVRGPHEGETMLSRPADGSWVRVGRDAPGAHVKLPRDEEVSSKHCRARVLLEEEEGDVLEVEDLGSLNGTTVEGEDASRTTVVVRLPANLRVGGTELEFALMPASPATTRRAAPSTVSFQSPAHRPFTRAKRRAVSTMARSTSKMDGRASPLESMILVKDAVMTAVRTVGGETRKRDRSVRDRSLSPAPFVLLDDSFQAEPLEVESYREDDVAAARPRTRRWWIGLCLSIAFLLGTTMTIRRPVEKQVADVEVNVLARERGATVSEAAVLTTRSVSPRHEIVSRTTARSAFLDADPVSGSCWWLPANASGKAVIRLAPGGVDARTLTRVSLRTTGSDDSRPTGNLYPRRVSFWSRGAKIGELDRDRWDGPVKHDFSASSSGRVEEVTVVVTGCPDCKYGTCVHRLGLYAKKPCE